MLTLGHPSPYPGWKGEQAKAAKERANSAYKDGNENGDDDNFAFVTIGTAVLNDDDEDAAAALVVSDNVTMSPLDITTTPMQHPSLPVSLSTTVRLRFDLVALLVFPIRFQAVERNPRPMGGWEDIPRASHSPKGEEADLRHSQLRHTPERDVVPHNLTHHPSHVTHRVLSSSPPPSSTIPSRHPTSSTPYLSRHDNGAEREGNGKGCTQVSTSASSSG